MKSGQASALGCGFNWSTQHLISSCREEDVGYEATTEEGIEMEGVRLREPCAYLAGMLTDRLLPAMVGRAGLRARILTSGTITVGGGILGA